MRRLLFGNFLLEKKESFLRLFRRLIFEGKEEECKLFVNIAQRRGRPAANAERVKKIV